MDTHDESAIAARLLRVLVCIAEPIGAAHCLPQIHVSFHNNTLSDYSGCYIRAIVHRVRIFSSPLGEVRSIAIILSVCVSHSLYV